MSFWTAFKSVFNKSEEILFSPEKCICCGREKVDETSPFCDSCKRKLIFIRGKICDYCGAPITGGKVCDKCKENKNDFDKARAIIAYDQASSPMITKFKYSKAKYLEKRLCEILCEGYAKYPELAPDFVTFVPMTEKKLKERGYNQTQVLASLFCEKNNLELKQLLVKSKETPAQAGLDKDKRKENIKDAFEIIAENRKLVKDKKILIIDDVFTTGSTTNECAKVLKKAGASSVFVLTIAKTI